MPTYLFRRGVQTKEIKATFAEADTLLPEMTRKGWRQVYTAPEICGMFITISEATNEMAELYRMADEGRGPLVGRPNDYDARSERAALRRSNDKPNAG